MKATKAQKPKLLVVDDEPDNLDLLYRTFHREFRVLRAESGPAALDLLSAEGGDISVIISDQRMPMMSGTEFLSLTATQYPDIIRIILTGYTDVEDLVEAINSGKVFKYVTKPWGDEELKGVVSQALDTHNVLKTRTLELKRSLRQESLLNTISRAMRTALSTQDILQTVSTTVGQMFEASCCVIRGFQDGTFADESFVYLNGNSCLSFDEATSRSLLGKTLWEVEELHTLIGGAEADALAGNEPELRQRRQAYADCQIASSLLVPLICKGELMAVLALHQHQSARNWELSETQLLQTVADQVALALAQARAYERIQASAKRETLINSITTAIRSSLEPQEIFSAITQQLGMGLQVDSCALSLWNRRDEYVQCVALHCSDLTENCPAPSFAEPDSDSPSGLAIADNPVLLRLLETQEPVVINDMQLAPEMTVEEFARRDTTRSEAKALMVVPMIIDGEIIGSISLRQNQRTRIWQAADIALAKSVAVQAAIAVQQAKLYQTTRQQAEQLIEADRQKTEFFQNISHEFRTPLTLTLGPLESAVATGQGLSLEQSQIALRNSRRLLRLVNQLLDLQRLDAGLMQATFRPCDLVEFVNQTVESFRAYCEKKEIRLVTQVYPCPQVYLDLERFDKVLYNLLSNAMKFTPEGGQISVRLRPEGDRCQLQVCDTGIGIRADQLPHLFTRFRQAEGSANRSYEGSGLGLSLVKELTELHGGSVTVESNYGEGTSFTVALPTGKAHLPPHWVLDEQAEIQRSRAAVELADLEMALQDLESKDLEEDSDASGAEDGETGEVATGARILIVDDNPDLRHYLSSILRGQGYQIQTARNGEEGLKKAQAFRPYLILTDLMMPKVSGVEMIKQLRQDHALKGTPIVLLTAKADEETRLDGMEHGADAYLSKPFNDRELLAEVRNLLALKENEQKVAELNTYLTESVLQRFLPSSLVQRAAQGELSLDLRPEPRLVTVLFTDIVGFTQMSNTLRSRKMAELLNEYLNAMTQVVFDNGGTVDKFIGDAILALYGAPEELSPNEQVRRAVDTGRQMILAMQRLNERWADQGIGPMQFRCGIHQGSAVVGMFGGELRSDYTAIGPSVNIAARLQDAAAPGAILISAAVADYLADDEISKGQPLALKGIDETVLTFTVLG
jgi:signal transduction histidine kinase/class 3 adenylate cyclase